jgi:hypothetical protein
MSALARSYRVGGAALAAGLGFATLAAFVTATPARADVRVQFGIVGIAPPPVVVAPSPPPPPTYGYVYGYPYAYSYPSPYYAAPAYGYGGPYYVQGRDDWHHRRWRDRDDWDDHD